MKQRILPNTDMNVFLLIVINKLCGQILFLSGNIYLQIITFGDGIYSLCSQKECHSSIVLNLTKVYWRRIPELMISNRYTKKDVPSAIGSRTVRGLGEVISGRSFPHTVQCVEATARTCDLSVHRRQALPLAPGRPFL